MKFCLKRYQPPIRPIKPTSVKKHQRKKFLLFAYTTMNKQLYLHDHLSYCLLPGVFYLSSDGDSNDILVMTYGQNGRPGKQNWYTEKSEKEQKGRPELYCFIEGEFSYTQ